MSRDIVDYHRVQGAPGICWAKHPTIHKPAPGTKNYLAPNVHRAMAEKAQDFELTG